MSADRQSGLDPALARVKAPAPGRLLWAAGLGVALAVHLAAAVPFLAPPEEPVAAPVDVGINVTLAPEVAPPPVEEPPEPEPEERRIEERAEDSPPPAPPPEPRETPDLPDIQPRIIPELWGGSGAPGAGALTLEEYLALQDWLARVRQTITDKLVYPEKARRRALAGRADLVITVERNGRLVAWNFRRRTGYALLDGAIERAMERSRRLPPFPAGTRHERLSFTLPVHFILMHEGRVMVPSEPDGTGGPTPPPRSVPADQGLSVAQLRRCAGRATELVARREAVAARRAELEELRTAYERQALRYHRLRQQMPRRVERMLQDYNAGVEQFDTDLNALNAELAAFSSECGKGSANWDNYRQACAPYMATGNAFCEAFGDLWVRLRSGR